ncbi:MAG: type II toxin-antitoxin system RelB family antitoxin [Fusobacteriaceae bacterium]
MSTVSLRLDDRDDKLVREYAKLNNLSISEFIRKVVIEKIEDEIDIKAFDKAFTESEIVYSFHDAMKEIGL